MGYESRVYVIAPYNFGQDKERKPAEIIARFNLCSCGNLVDIFTEPCPYLIYNEDRGEETDPYVEEDKYGSRLTMATAQDVLDAIKKDKEAWEYRRTRDLYEYLKSSIGHYDELYVVHYGY